MYHRFLLQSLLRAVRCVERFASCCCLLGCACRPVWPVPPLIPHTALALGTAIDPFTFARTRAETPMSLPIPAAYRERVQREPDSSYSLSTDAYTPRTYAPRTYSSAGRSPSATATRDAHGRIKRSEAAKDAFKRQQPCPSTGRRSGACPGYVIDHVKPLECGGADDPSNMQWQTVADGKAKDKTERNCR